MPSFQLNFTIRTSSRCKSVHLVGSWDNYQNQVSLRRDKSKSGVFKEAFRFNSPTLQPGGRYWYYYLLDGTTAVHDPSRESIIEPTSGQKLNILDVPQSKASSTLQYQSYDPITGALTRPTASGRSLSPSQIQSPLPSRPYETQYFRIDKSRELEALARQYASQRLTDSDDSSSESDRLSGRSSGRSLPSPSSRSSGSSSPSSLDSPVTPGSSSGSPELPMSNGHSDSKALPTSYGSLGEGNGCICNRFARLSNGQKVQINCGGAVCLSDTSSQGGTSESSEDERRRRAKHHHHHSSKHSSSKSKSSKSKSSRSKR